MKITKNQELKNSSRHQWFLNLLRGDKTKSDGGKVVLVSKKLLLRYQVKQTGKIPGIDEIMQTSLQKRESMVVGK